METIKSIFWTIIKLALLATFLSCLIAGLTPLRIDASWILLAILVVLGMKSIRRSFPYPFNALKRLGLWVFKSLAGWLWKKPQKKGGVSAREPRMRWRD